MVRMKLFFRFLIGIVFFTAFLYIISKSLIQLGSGEALIISSSNSRWNRIILGPAWNIEYELFLPIPVEINRVRLNNRVSNINYKKDLSFGLSEYSKIDTNLKIEGRLVYSISPESFEELYFLDPESDSNFSSLASELAQSILEKKVSQIYKSGMQLKQLEQETREYLDQKLFLDSKLEFQKQLPGIILKEVRIIKVTLPDEPIYQKVMSSKEDIIRIRMDKSIAALKGEAFAIEMMKRDDAYFNRLERTAQFLQKYPEMKDVVALEKLNEKVQILGIPPEKILGEFIKEKSGNSRNRNSIKAIE